MREVDERPGVPCVPDAGLAVDHVLDLGLGAHGGDLPRRGGIEHRAGSALDVSDDGLQGFDRTRRLQECTGSVEDRTSCLFLSTRRVVVVTNSIGYNVADARDRTSCPILCVQHAEDKTRCLVERIRLASLDHRHASKDEPFVDLHEALAEDGIGRPPVSDGGSVVLRDLALDRDLLDAAQGPGVAEDATFRAEEASWRGRGR
jgi:hypothetical protein